MTVDASLLWRCRRGIREMDILLRCFIERHYDHLSDEEKTGFANLLEQTDPDIMDWIMEKSETPPAFRPLIAMIRDTQKTGDH